MKISLNQLRRIIKEEVIKATKLQEQTGGPEANTKLLEFTFISPEDEDDFEAEYPEYRDYGFVLVCDNPEKCADEFFKRVTKAGALSDYEFQSGHLAGYDFGVVLYGTQKELTQAGYIFAEFDHELGGSGFSLNTSDVPELVRQKMRPVE
jgi:hypothetical protein